MIHERRVDVRDVDGWVFPLAFVRKGTQGDDDVTYVRFTNYLFCLVSCHCLGG